MPEYVIDASVVVQYLIEDQFTPQITSLFEQSEPGDQFFMPEFGLVECVNVLWKQARFHSMPESQAMTLLIDLLAMPLEILDASDLLELALPIGIAHKLAIYDSVYIAMAIRLSCPLITVDEKQKNAAIASGITIKAVTDFLPPTKETS